MSAVDNYKAVRTVTTLTSAVTGLFTACAEMHNAINALDNGSLKPILPYQVNPVQPTIKKVVSPADARISFIEKLKSYSGQKLKTEDNNFAIPKKAVLSAISDSHFIVNNRTSFNESLNQFIKAEPNNLNAPFNNLMRELENQHQEVFTSNMESLITATAAKLQFEENKVSRESDTTIIISSNGKNQALRTEIRVDSSSKQINLTTEVLGMCDSSCKSLLDQFEVELRKNGVTYDQRNHKRTGPIPFTSIVNATSNKIKSSINKENNPYQPTFQALYTNSKRIKQ